jgi:glycosyltransferase involved in cell wall biosynthesis
MSLGKPVVATNWSGNVDFMHHGNSCPVDYALVPIDGEYGPYRSGSHWAEPDLDHAASLLRRLVADSAWRERLAAEGRATIEREFSPEAAGERYLRRIRRISTT